MKTINHQTLLKIYQELLNNPFITEAKLANILNISERTIRRYIKILKEMKVIKLVRKGKNRYWKTL